jgi:hypothetical protein
MVVFVFWFFIMKKPLSKNIFLCKALSGKKGALYLWTLG